MVALGDLPGGSINATATVVSADGSVVVGTAQAGGGAFIWDEVNGLRHLQTALTDEYGLDLGDWIFSGALGISADGRTIVGNGSRPGIATQPWIAYLGPPPCRGDINKDDRVDLSDLVTLLANYATPSGAAHADGDIDYDMDIDLTDLAMLLGNFGKICQ